LHSLHYSFWPCSLPYNDSSSAPYVQNTRHNIYLLPLHTKKHYI
jgi:hypothetical protein